MAIRVILPIAATLILSACGGGGGASFNTTPLASTGFAEASGGFGGAYDFTIERATRTVSVGNVLSQEKGTIRISGTAGQGPIIVVLNGETYTLQRASDNNGPARSQDGNDLVSLSSAIVGTDFVELTSLFAVIDGNLNSGIFARGFDTDPAIVQKMTGTADFQGGIEAAIRSGFDNAFGSGVLNMSVDFDGNTISGRGVLNDEEISTADFTFDPVTIRFEQAQIDENSFAGSVSVESPLIGTLNDATYDGRFFGPNADSVAGQFVGRIDIDGSDIDTFINGGFVATK
jgi:hypothetical protein